jgi:hypothetical protein
VNVDFGRRTTRGVLVLRTAGTAGTNDCFEFVGLGNHYNFRVFNELKDSDDE